jgi:hypothetical protein
MPKTRQALRANYLGIIAMVILAAWSALPIRDAGRRAYEARCGTDAAGPSIICKQRLP